MTVVLVRAGRCRPVLRSLLLRWLVRSTLAVAHFSEAPTSSASISVTDRFSPSGGLPAALAQPASNHHPVALAQGVGQVLGLATPDVDLEERGVAVAPLALLLNALGDGHAQVGYGDAARG